MLPIIISTTTIMSYIYHHKPVLHNHHNEHDEPEIQLSGKCKTCDQPPQLQLAGKYEIAVVSEFVECYESESAG